MHTNKTFQRTREIMQERNFVQPVDFTKHASLRLQQRCISESQTQLIFIYGELSYDNEGAVRYFMSKRAMKKVRAELGQTPQIERLAGMYVVTAIDTNAVITVGHRH